MENSNKLKADFVRMCGLLEITANGLQFPDEIAELDDDFQDVFESSDYPILREKMDNLINLINSDTSLINKDIEDELWYMI
jgi:hypothetical protein